MIAYGSTHINDPRGGMTQGDFMTFVVTGIPFLGLMGTVAAICVIFAVLTVRIPGNMASRVASGGSFGLANALRNL